MARSRWACTTKKLVDVPTSNLLCSASSCCLAARAQIGGFDPLEDALELDRGVGHLRGNLQFELPDLAWICRVCTRARAYAASAGLWPSG